MEQTVPRQVIRLGARLAVGVVVVAVAARISLPVPGSPVPQSLQTLAVVLVGAWLGPRAGALSLVLYIVAGGLGAPVFADGSGGLDYLAGPTMGYLVGFVAGAALMGWLVRQSWGSSLVGALLGAFVGSLLAHGVILTLGWARLGAITGPLAAWESGVAPFLVGGVAKSGVASLGWVGLHRFVNVDGGAEETESGPRD